MENRPAGHSTLDELSPKCDKGPIRNRKKCRARFGKADTARRAVEQAYVEPVFQLPDRVADRRGRHAKCDCSRSKAMRFRDTHEYAESIECIGFQLCPCRLYAQ